MPADSELTQTTTKSPPASTALEPEVERLIAELPTTYDELLSEPAHRTPAVVERLVDRGWALFEPGDARHSVVAGDVARLLAGELPGGLGATGEAPTAEAALLAAFELLAQTPDPEPAELAAILGRLALVATDRGYPEDLERYAGEAVRVARASDREWPMPAFLHLWRAVSDLEGGESVEQTARAVFDAMWQASPACCA